MSPKLLLESVALCGLGLYRHPLAKCRGSRQSPQGDDGEQHAAGSGPSQCHPCNEPRLYPTGAEQLMSHTSPCPLLGSSAEPARRRNPLQKPMALPKGQKSQAQAPRDSIPGLGNSYFAGGNSLEIIIYFFLSPFFPVFFGHPDCSGTELGLITSPGNGSFLSLH